MANDIISADFDNLRAVSQQLIASVEDLEAHRQTILALKQTAQAEAALNTKNKTPGAIYSPVLASLDAALTKIDTALSQFINNVTGDAEALRKMADTLEGATGSAAQQIADTANQTRIT